MTYRYIWRSYWITLSDLLFSSRCQLYLLYFLVSLGIHPPGFLWSHLFSSRFLCIFQVYNLDNLCWSCVFAAYRCFLYWLPLRAVSYCVPDACPVRLPSLLRSNVSLLPSVRSPWHVFMSSPNLTLSSCFGYVDRQGEGRLLICESCWCCLARYLTKRPIKLLNLKTNWAGFFYKARVFAKPAEKRLMESVWAFENNEGYLLLILSGALLSADLLRLTDKVVESRHVPI